MPAVTIRKIRLLLAAAFVAVATVAVLAVVTVEQVIQGSNTGGTPPDALLFFGGAGASIVLAFAVAWIAARSIRRDLVHRAAVEAALRRSEAQFSGILNIAVEAIVTVDKHHNIVHFNHGAEAIFGYQAADVIGQPLALLLPERLVGPHDGHMNRFAASGETSRRMAERRDVSGRRKNGEEFPAEASISKLDTPDGPLFTAVMRDITERKRLEHHEHHLAVAGLRLAATLDYDSVLHLAAELPVHAVGEWCVLDLAEDGEGGKLRRIVSNHTDVTHHMALRTLEHHELNWDAPSEVIDVFRSIAPRLLPDVSDDWLQAHAADEDELHALRALQIRSLLFVPLLVRDRVVGVMTIGTSIHSRGLDGVDQKLAEALAERSVMAIENAMLYQHATRATAARDDVLAIVAHDLRNPTSAISMCARTLLEHPPESAAERHVLEATILESATWMHRLMQDLLDVASIDAGRLAVEPSAQDVRPILEAAIEMVAEQARAASVALHAMPVSGLPAVLADRDRIVQVLSNLLSNAIRFSNAGGTVTIEAASGIDDVIVGVHDTGIGIAPVDLPHIFDRFWHTHRDQLTRGAGLGLAIARGIVMAHQGRLWVTSEVGRGSSFFFSLRIAD